MSISKLPILAGTLIAIYILHNDRTRLFIKSGKRKMNDCSLQNGDMVTTGNLKFPLMNAI